jgi:SHS2 domain-containing protein
MKPCRLPDHAEPGWQHFPHGADIGVRGVGATLEEAFAQAATALTAVITDPAQVQPVEAVTIRCQAPDVETLLVDWLNALVLEMATRDMLFSRFEVHIHGTRLDAVALGDAVAVAHHQPAVEVKGATFTELQVSRAADGLWCAQCVVDV